MEDCDEDGVQKADIKNDHDSRNYCFSGVGLCAFGIGNGVKLGQGRKQATEGILQDAGSCKEG